MEVQTDGSVMGKFTFENHYYFPTEHIHVIGLIESIPWYTSKETCTDLQQYTH